MEGLTKRAIMEDVSLRKSSRSLWQFQKDKPEIRQIYGHFLPPYHMKLVRGLVAKDFNFPAAYHAAANSLKLSELYAIGEKFTPDTIVSINDSIKIRGEKDGAIVYTPYFNGFYMNRSAYEILKCCKDKGSLNSIVTRQEYDLETVTDFLMRAFILGIINVYP